MEKSIRFLEKVVLEKTAEEFSKNFLGHLPIHHLRT